MRTEVRARCVGTMFLYKSGLLIATSPKAFATGELDNLKEVISQLQIGSSTYIKSLTK